MTATDLPIISFTTAEKWDQWLEKNHNESAGIWMRFFKKNTTTKSITYDEALDVALCYGWIDSQVKKYDEKSYLQRFTPRRSKSIWSKINTEHIERLIKEGRMKPAGLKVVEEAKKDGRWNAAYSSPTTMILPDDFFKKLATDKKAEAFFNTLNKTNVYAIAWRLETAKKPETREKRMHAILAMLSKGEKFQ